MVARKAHNLEIVGSSPTSATTCNVDSFHLSPVKPALFVCAGFVLPKFKQREVILYD